LREAAQERAAPGLPIGEFCERKKKRKRRGREEEEKRKKS